MSNGRRVQNPYKDREDIGSYGIYVGNWSGRRKKQVVNDHIAADLVARNPAQILLAQEVDPEFVETLLRPAESEAANSAPHPVSEEITPTVVGNSFDQRYVNMTPWHVAVQGKDEGSLIIAARSSRAESCWAVEKAHLFHREYKKKGKTRMVYSDILVAQVKWHKPMHGEYTLQILNVHFHHLVAKQDPTQFLTSVTLAEMSTPTEIMDPPTNLALVR